MPLAIGTRLGPYEILGSLGAGGMGEVYRARDPRLGREVAVKVLPEDLAGDPGRLRRFEAEARAVGALNHPNILAVFDTGAAGAGPYVVFELLGGETLRRHLERGALPVRKSLECAAQIAQGLAAAHARGIVHRDLKPENLFLTRDGRVKILDFGLAKTWPPPAVAESRTTQTALTGAGAVVGTAAYMSPEQVQGRPLDQRSDIFSLGSGRRSGPPTLPAFARSGPRSRPTAGPTPTATAATCRSSGWRTGWAASCSIMFRTSVTRRTAHRRHGLAPRTGAGAGP
jgi:eukaryotic-like serine/threonine-protein kinase